MRKKLIALALASLAFGANAVIDESHPSTGWKCWQGVVAGGTDEPDANGMYPPALWGRYCLPDHTAANAG